MSVGSFATLKSAVISASVAKSWGAAVLEWDIVSVEEDPTGEGECVCGQLHLVHLFTIQNRRNHAALYPIGSVCINRFGVADLDYEVSILPGLWKLRDAIRKRTPIVLSSDWFSRSMLAYLYDNGAFTPDQWNGNDGVRDYDFLLDMFNKRIKDNITNAQNRKISVLLNTKVLPFLESDTRLNKER